MVPEYDQVIACEQFEDVVDYPFNVFGWLLELLHEFLSDLAYSSPTVHQREESLGQDIARNGNFQAGDTRTRNLEITCRCRAILNCGLKVRDHCQMTEARDLLQIIQ